MVEQIKVEIVAEATKALNEIRRTVAGLQSLASGAAIVGGAYLGMKAVLEPVVSTMKQLIDAASRQESAEMKLQIAMRNAGIEAKTSTTELLRHADTLQRLTGIESSTIIEVEKLLTTFGLSVNEIKRATTAVLDFATATDVDLRTAAMTIGKAYQGQTDTLSRYGIKIDESIDKHHKYAAVLQQLESRFRGFAEMSGSTFAGSQKKLSSAIDEVMGELGRLITDAPAVKGALDLMATGTNKLADTFRQAREEGTGFVGAIGSLITGKPFFATPSPIMELKTLVPQYEDTMSKISNLEAKIKEYETLAKDVTLELMTLEEQKHIIGLAKEYQNVTSEVKKLKIEAADLFINIKSLGLPEGFLELPEPPKPEATTIIPKVDEAALEKFKNSISQIEQQLGLISERQKIEIQFDLALKNLPEGLDISQQIEAFSALESLKAESLRQVGAKEKGANLETTKRAIDEEVALRKNAVQGQIDDIKSLQTTNEIEKINRLTSLQEGYQDDFIAFKIISNAKEQLVAGRSERELEIIEGQLEREKGLREAQLAAQQGVLEAEEAATIARYENEQKLIDVKNQYLIAAATTAGQAISTTFAEASVQGIDMLSSAIGRAVVYSENLGAAIKQVGKAVLSMIIETMAKWLIMHAVGKALAKTTTISTIVESAAIAAAWAPAATLAAIATLGGAVATGKAAMVAAVATMPATQAAVSGLAMAGTGAAGAAEGGYTLNQGLVFLHPREIIAPEMKMVEVFQGVLKNERRGVLFNEGAVQITINHPAPAPVSIDEIAESINEAFANVIV